MLHQISWFTFAVSILLFTGIYYLYVVLTFYRLEIQAVFNKLTGKQALLKSTGRGDIEFPGYAIMGKAQSDDVAFVSQDELSFGPAETPDEEVEKAFKASPVPDETNSGLADDFSEMAAEVKTLAIVINESRESKENFGMLFRLIIQKYHTLAGTIYQQRINDLLLGEGAAHFPFSLTPNDLANYWTNEN